MSAPWLPFLALVSLLLTASLSGCVGGADLPGSSLFADDDHDGSGDHADDHADHHDAESTHEADREGTHGPDHPQTGMERPDFPEGEGRVPTAEDARSLPQLSRARIIGDEAFKPANGVVYGNGTLADPFIIEGWYVTGDLTIQDTDACVVVRENYVGGQLTLNWNGQCVHAHHNYVRDLRVNENIRRTGYATGGFIEHNEIDVVGQLRHYDGVFQYNTVGPGGSDSLFDPVLETVPFGFARDPRVANIDGFNQGIIQGNTFLGSVDLDFHGHHHGTGFFSPHSHYHGDNESREMPHDHTRRWTNVRFVDNVIEDFEGYGLRYDDRNHAGDDRTATSEQEETLAEEHIHRSRVEILDNTLEGAGIWVDVFNAEDKLHTERNDGWLTVSGNTVVLHERDEGPLGLYGSYDASSAILVQSGREAEVRVSDNQLRFVAAEDDGYLGILDPSRSFAALRLDRIADADVSVLANRADGFDVGVAALRFEDVSWRLSGNDFGDAQEFDADDTVPMPER